MLYRRTNVARRVVTVTYKNRHGSRRVERVVTSGYAAISVESD